MNQKLYNVVDTEGRTKGLKNNAYPLTRSEALKFAASQTYGRPKLVLAGKRQGLRATRRRRMVQ